MQQRRKAEATGQRAKLLGNSLNNKAGGGQAKVKLTTVIGIFTAVVFTIVALIVTFATNSFLSSSEIGHYLHQTSASNALAAGKTSSSSGSSSSGGNRRENAASSGEEVEYHIIFSSGCKVSQDWQSYVFFFHAMKSEQPGTVTRIVSGCDEEQEAAMRKVFREQIEPMSSPEGRFKIHFTPDYSNLKPEGGAYKYWNKPFGTKHWMENALDYPDNPITEDAIVILLDPDQAIIRPFTNNDFSNTDWKNVKEGQEPRTRIEHGKPMGQQYGFGLQWKSKVNMTNILPNEKSPVDELTNEQARDFIVGPPYIATARDMYKIATKWCFFAIPVHDQYPKLLAEMFAYCIAAAHLKLPHQVAASFMVSDIGVGRGEGWSYIDKMDASEVCLKHDPAELPNVLHFCQRYGLGYFFFGKYRLPDDFLTCESPLMAEPPEDIAVKNQVAYFPPEGNIKEWSKVQAKRNGFMVCSMIGALNSAATYFKIKHCGDKGNFQKTLTYVEPTTT